jgi:hypothetical protein
MLVSATPLRRLASAAAGALGLAAMVLSSLTLSSAAAQEKPKPSPPVLVTSIGQSLDGFQVQLVVRRAGIAYKYDARAEPDMLTEAKTVFLAVGASLKGFGEAGITIKDELARTTHLLDEAKKLGVYVVVLHMGGEERRDALSNQLIELAAPRAPADHPRRQRRRRDVRGHAAWQHPVDQDRRRHQSQAVAGTVRRRLSGARRGNMLPTGLAVRTCPTAVCDRPPHAGPARSGLACRLVHRLAPAGDPHPCRRHARQINHDPADRRRPARGARAARVFGDYRPSHA